MKLPFALLLAAVTPLVAESAPARRPAAQILVPGFTVRELPIALTSLNNIEYAADGRLFAGGYDGRFHVLRDTDGDGLEDKVDTFSAKPSSDYPLGIAVKDGEPYFVLSREVIRFRDRDGDGVPETREVFTSGFDDPALATASYLLHRRVDNAMAVSFGPDGALYLTMGSAAYQNPYWKEEKTGVNHYTTNQHRGCLLRITPDGKIEQLVSGLRYIMALQWNRHGDLFATEQEGATWVPNGNPFDELLHLQTGRHYGFPPRHPVHLPDVIDEPSVWDFSPQHQSTCGFRFNGPAPGRGRFGTEWWSDDALITGESRGKLWRTKLAKTAAGYVAHRPRRRPRPARGRLRDFPPRRSGYLLPYRRARLGQRPDRRRPALQDQPYRSGRAATRANVAGKRNGNHHRLRPATRRHRVGRRGRSHDDRFRPLRRCGGSSRSHPSRLRRREGAAKRAARVRRHKIGTTLRRSPERRFHDRTAPIRRQLRRGGSAQTRYQSRSLRSRRRMTR